MIQQPRNLETDPCADSAPSTRSGGTKISFVIPVYRNAGTLEPTYRQLTTLFSGPLQKFRYELVFVDDGSDDRSLEELLRLREKDERVIVLSLTRNFGQIPAVVAGFRHATGDAVVTLAADMQEPPDAVVEFVREWKAGEKVVIGLRTRRHDSLAANVFGTLYWKLLDRVTPNMPMASDFFLLDREAVDAFNQIEESDRLCGLDVLWLGYSPKSVPYERVQRRIGKSQWSVSKKIKLAIDGLLNVTHLPIRAISIGGILVALLGFGTAIFLVFQRIVNGTSYPGWYSMICLLLILNGSTMLMLGVIGEYIWRIYNQTRGRPTYLIKKNPGDRAQRRPLSGNGG